MYTPCNRSLAGAYIFVELAKTWLGETCLNGCMDANPSKRIKLTLEAEIDRDFIKALIGTHELDKAELRREIAEFKAQVALLTSQLQKHGQLIDSTQL